MDTTSEFEKILQLLIAYVTGLSDAAAITTMLGFTKSFLFIIDEPKAPEYKAAIVLEFLEDIAPFLNNPDISALREYCLTQKSHGAQSKFSREALEAVKKFIDPRRVSPELVVFWLQQNCNSQILKNMYTFMLFLTKEQQEQVYKKDITLLQDPKVQLLKDTVTKL